MSGRRKREEREEKDSFLLWRETTVHTRAFLYGPIRADSTALNLINKQRAGG